MVFNDTFINISVRGGQFIGGGNRSTRRKPYINIYFLGIYFGIKWAKYYTQIITDSPVEVTESTNL